MITSSRVNEIGQSVQSHTPISEETVNRLRQSFPDVHFTYCMDDDVFQAQSVYEHSSFNLYLIDGRDHCLCFTNDMNIATGVVVAEIEEE